MPRIDIITEENVANTQVDSTSTVVLIPLLVTDATAKVSLLDAAAKLENTYGNIVLTWGNGEYKDLSYAMAHTLLSAGLKVLIKPIAYTDEATIESVKIPEALINFVNTAIANSAFDEFASKNLYNVKYLTSGIYPNWPIKVTSGDETTNIGCADKLCTLAATRGDCIGLVELENKYTTIGTSDNELLDFIIGGDTITNGSFGACYYPWGEYNVSAGSTTAVETMPGCFGFLSALANSLSNNNPDWLSIAGASRGIIPNLKTPAYDITDAIADVMTGDDNGATGILRVNPIRQIGEYGLRIWGNKVYSKNADTTKSSYAEFLNVTTLACDIKKQIFSAANRVTFEPNDNITWFNFKSFVNVLLDRMKQGRGLDWYAWERLRHLEAKGQICARLIVKPIEAVESFKIVVTLTDSDVQTTEE